MGRFPPVAVNNETFDIIRRNGMAYVDKTSMLVRICEEMSAGKIPLHMYARPTRFGKTLNQSMISRFFDAGGSSRKEDMALATEMLFSSLSHGTGFSA